MYFVLGIFKAYNIFISLICMCVKVANCTYLGQEGQGGGTPTSATCCGEFGYETRTTTTSLSAGGGEWREQHDPSRSRARAHVSAAGPALAAASGGPSCPSVRRRRRLIHYTSRRHHQSVRFNLHNEPPPESPADFSIN